MKRILITIAIVSLMLTSVSVLTIVTTPTALAAEELKCTARETIVKESENAAAVIDVQGTDSNPYYVYVTYPDLGGAGRVVTSFPYTFNLTQLGLYNFAVRYEGEEVSCDVHYVRADSNTKITCSLASRPAFIETNKAIEYKAVSNDADVVFDWDYAGDGSFTKSGDQASVTYATGGVKPGPVVWDANDILGTLVTCPSATVPNPKTPTPSPAKTGDPATGGSGGSGGSSIFDLSTYDPLRGQGLMGFVRNLAARLLSLAFPLLIILIVWSGFMFLTSQGEPDKINKARSILLYALLGFAVIIIGEGFVTLIKSILNLR